MIDISKIKPGDTITVELVVSKQKQGDTDKVIRTLPSGPKTATHYHLIDSNAIVGHTPKPVEIMVGTTFPFDGLTAAEWEILMIHDTTAWCIVRNLRNTIKYQQFQLSEIQSRLNGTFNFIYKTKLTNLRSMLNYSDKG